VREVEPSHFRPAMTFLVRSSFNGDTAETENTEHISPVHHVK
jgi:hypothetical protein